MPLWHAFVVFCIVLCSLETEIKTYSNKVNGDYLLIYNERYMIPDLTYIRASASMCMPQLNLKILK